MRATRFVVLRSAVLLLALGACAKTHGGLGSGSNGPGILRDAGDGDDGFAGAGAAGTPGVTSDGGVAPVRRDAGGAVVDPARPDAGPAPGLDAGPGARPPWDAGRPIGPGRPDAGPLDAGRPAPMTCRPGFRDDGNGRGCVDINECLRNNGGCDWLRACVNTPGSRTCGACQDGYIASGAIGCSPVLTDLVVANGTLEPGYSPQWNSYTVRVPILTDTIELYAYAADGVQLSSESRIVPSGSIWPVPSVFEPGAYTYVPITATDPVRAATTYEINVWRDDLPDYLKGDVTPAGEGMGVRVAASEGLVLSAAPNAQESRGVVFAYRYGESGWELDGRLQGDGVQPGDAFGHSLAFMSGAAVVGAPYDDGGQSDSGAIYLMVRTDAGYQQLAYLKASTPHAGDAFGFSVALAPRVVAAGAPYADGADGTVSDSGAVHVFELDQNAGWVEHAIRPAHPTANDRFGSSVALWGTLLAVSAPGEDGSVPGIDGDETDEGAPDSGAVYVFGRTAAGWEQQAYIKASNPVAAHPDDNAGTGGDAFGWSEPGPGIALAAGVLVVGAPGEDSSASGVDGDQNDESARQSGAVYVFANQGSGWYQEAYLKPDNAGAGDQFGTSVAASGSGRIVVGARYESGIGYGITGDGSSDGSPGSGAAYVFDRVGGRWSQHFYLKAGLPRPGDNFGASVAVSLDAVVVGAPLSESPLGTYVFRR